MNDATKDQDVNQAAPPSEPVCETCKGVGMIGGFVNADSGYDGMPCPECSPKGDPSAALRGEPKPAETPHAASGSSQGARSDGQEAFPRCTEKLRAAGKAYPRTCAECGLGPCRAAKSAEGGAS